MGLRHLIPGLGALALGMVGMGQTVLADPVTPAAYNSPEVHATFSSSGATRESGGATWTYSGLTPSDFQSMWWGPTTVGLGFNGVADTLTFGSFSGSVATWTGTSQIQVFNGVTYQTRSVDTELLMTLQTPGAVFSANPAGTTNGADYQITGNTFSVNLQFLARFQGGGSYVAAKPFYDGLQTNPSLGSSGLQSSFGASFFVEDKPAAADAATPLPTAALGGIVLLGGAVTRRARRWSRA